MAKSTRRTFIRRAGVGTLLSLSRVFGGSIATVPSIAALASDGGRLVRAVDSAMPHARWASSAGPQGPMRAHEFGIVGQYDVEWLLEPRLQRLLDNMAASRPAFSGMRFFHSLDSGTRASTIQTDALDGGTVWTAAGAPVDFSITFKSLEALTSRDLIPFVGLNFFPKAIADRAISPPASFDRWKALVRRFLDELAADPRFGAAAIRTWWFEVWNEPNASPFWQGRYNPQYFDLYRATSEAVVASGHTVRLGGPAIVFDRRGADARTAMEDFLKFVSAEPEVKCEFISLHAKGTWSSHQEPEFLDAFNAAVETADLALTIDRSRFSGLPIINDEADMRVGFDVPYRARMDTHFAAWLTALMIAYDTLSWRFNGAGFRFLAASDNANQQLVETSFDGRRSIMTRASSSPRDLLKLPVYNFYEILRLLGDRHGTFIEGSEEYFPNSELFHIITAADSHISSVFSIYPRSTKETPRTCAVDYSIVDIAWPMVNIARYRIDHMHSNSYAAAGWESHAAPFPSARDTAKIRKAQELTISRPIEVGRPLVDGAFREHVTIAPYAVLAFWITPFIPDRPADPAWLEATVEDGNVILRWQPNVEPYFYSYELYLIEARQTVLLLSPIPLRSALWVDTAPPAGRRTYGICAVSASGIKSGLVESATVTI